MNISLVISGNSYSLTDGTVCRLSGHDGLGMSPLHRLNERSPSQHGDSDMGFRLDPRIFSLIFAIQSTSMSDFDDRRASLLRYLRPTIDEFALHFTLDNGDVRRIDAVLLDAPMSVDYGGVPRLSRYGFQFRAANPTFYHPTDDVVTFGLAAGGDGLDIPLTIPMSVGQSDLDQTNTITYEGTWLTYPIITINGPISDAIIENETTDESLDFTGTTISSSDYYTIDCRWGYKTVEDSSGTNKIADLTSDSDLATFHLEAPTGGATGKGNSIKVTGNTVNADTEIFIRYNKRYMGI